MLESVVGKDFLPRGSGDYCTLPSQILYLSFTQLLANDMLKNAQVLLQGVLLSCSSINLMRAAENMQNFSIYLERDLLILVAFLSMSRALLFICL